MYRIFNSIHKYPYAAAYLCARRLYTYVYLKTQRFLSLSLPRPSICLSSSLSFSSFLRVYGICSPLADRHRDLSRFLSSRIREQKIESLARATGKFTNAKNKVAYFLCFLDEYTFQRSPQMVTTEIKILLVGRGAPRREK